jgi:hypothetical protein
MRIVEEGRMAFTAELAARSYPAGRLQRGEIPCTFNWILALPTERGKTKENKTD